MTTREKQNKKQVGVFVPAEVLRCKNLTAVEGLVLSEIAYLTVNYGYCDASNKFFADLFGMTAIRASQVITRLAGMGYICVEIQGGNGKRFGRKVFLTNVAEPLFADCDYKEALNIKRGFILTACKRRLLSGSLSDYKEAILQKYNINKKRNKDFRQAGPDSSLGFSGFAYQHPNCPTGQSTAGQVPEKELKAIFNKARLEYPGRVLGVDVEFDNLKNRYPDWMEIVPMLGPAVEELKAAGPRKQSFMSWINKQGWKAE